MLTGSEAVVAQRGWKDFILEQKDALLCIIDQGVVSVAGFTTSVLIGRHAPEELGIYFIALSIILFIRGFQEQMISIPYTIFHHKYAKVQLPGYRGSCLVQQFGLTVVTFLFLLAMTAASYWGWLETTMVSPLIVLLLLMPALLMREVVRQYCFTHQENVKALAIDSAITVLQIGGLVGLGYFGVLSGTSAWAVIGLSCLLILSYWYFQNGPEIRFAKESISKDWKQNWSFGKWAVGGQLIGSFPTYILPWMLVAAAGTEGTGFFAAAMTLVGIANIFNTGMANFLTPKAAQVYVDEGAIGLRRVVIRITLIFLLVIGSFVALLAVLGGWIAVELYGSKYNGLQSAMTVLAIAKLCDSFAIVASNGLFVMERMKANFWVDVVLMAVTITVAICLIFPYGVMGAVFTSLVSAATSAVLRFVLLVIFLNSEIEVEESHAA